MTLLNNIITDPIPSAPKGIIYGPPGVGKAQPLDAKVLTPNGYIAMGTLKVGGKVIGANGKPCNVLGIYSQGEKEVFRVTMLDGSSTECTDDHLWWTQTRNEKRHGNFGAARPLSTIRKTLKSGTHFNHAIPRIEPVEFGASQDLPIHPWLLGMYLGDGHADTSVIITNPEEDIQTKIQKLLPVGDHWSIHDRIGLRVSKKTSHEPSAFMEALRNLGLDKLRSNTKFIPEEYLLSTIENRLELLRGLCDSDGFVCGAGMMEYVTVSKQLAHDVRFLAKSLGADVTTKQKIPSYTYKGNNCEGQLAYILRISVKNGWVPVSSKKHLQKWQSPTWSRTNSIRSVESVGTKQCQCIKVDALDSLYVTDDFIVTHNTTFGASATNALVIDCENGASAIVCQRTPYLATWPEIYQWLIAIETEEHPYQAIAIDSVDWLLRRIEEHVSGCAGGKTDSTLNRSHGGYGNGKQVLKNYVYQILLPLLDRIVARGIAVLLLAHTKRTEITDIDGITVEKTTPELPEGYLNVMVEWSDFVCLARMDGEGNRTLTTRETPRALAKNRYHLPESIPFDWTCFAEAIGEGLKQTFSQTNTNPNNKE
ncbi:MAG: AAA family ATPase [Pirellulales bacterium]|nr:AAA family ATPase [Pirellulales bacterium]